MAGSERLEKSGTEKNGVMKASAIVNNFGNFSVLWSCEVLSKKKHPIKGGGPIPKDVPWKGMEHSKALKPIFDGTSLCGFLFCISQAKDNSGETWCTLKMGHLITKIRANVIKPKFFSIKKAVKQAEVALLDA